MNCFILSIYSKINAMNRIIIIILLISGFSAYAQNEKAAFPKTINVNGSAEMEVVPDEIYVRVYLREFEKKGQGRVLLESIKTNFLTAARSKGIPDSAIAIASYDGYNSNPWLRRKKRDDLYSSIAYEVKLTNSRQMDDLVSVLDEDATQNFLITRVSHSRISEYRKQLKIQAVKAAKEKAGYLSEAIGEKLGEAITVNEPAENIALQGNYNGNATLRGANYSIVYDKKEPGFDSDSGPVDFRRIKLRFDVNVVFSLK